MDVDKRQQLLNRQTRNSALDKIFGKISEFGTVDFRVIDPNDNSREFRGLIAEAENTAIQVSTATDGNIPIYGKEPPLSFKSIVAKLNKVEMDLIYSAREVGQAVMTEHRSDGEDFPMQLDSIIVNLRGHTTENYKELQQNLKSLERAGELGEEIPLSGEELEALQVQVDQCRSVFNAVDKLFSQFMDPAGRKLAGLGNGWDDQPATMIVR